VVHFGWGVGNLRLVDHEVVGAANVQVTMVALVTHQRLVTPLELLSQHRHDRLLIGGVLAGLVVVETDDVEAVVPPHLLDLQR